MRALLAAIRNVMRAMRRAAARFREDVVEIGGKMVRMLVPSGVPDEPDEAIPAEQPVDDFGHRVRSLAAQLIDDGVPNPDLMASLPPDTVRWLSVCTDPMLSAVAKASDDELRDHVKGRRSIRGVLCSDAESVREWIAAQTGSEPDDPELDQKLAWVPA